MPLKITKQLIFLAIIVCCIFFTQCNESEEENPDSFTLSSTAFTEGGKIPQKYGCSDNQDHLRPSIPLTWSNAPLDTKNFILLMDDPDPVARYWIHWIVINIPADITDIAEGETLTEDSTILLNSWGEEKFGGPCPPNGIHTYRFQLFAMSQQVIALDSSDKKGDELTNEIKAMNPLAVATLTADYP